MKKQYMTPRLKVMMMDTNEDMLQASQIVGFGEDNEGKADYTGNLSRRQTTVWDEHDEE